jgi:hypothetical protein
MEEILESRLIGTAWVEVYKCQAEFFIEIVRFKDEAGNPVTLRNLIVRYGPGYCGPWLPKGKDGTPTFGGQIPDDWTTADVIALLLTPPFEFEECQYLKRYPPWEAGARYSGHHHLVRCRRTPEPTYDPWCQ